MAVFNELQVGRFNRALQKLTGIKGTPPVKQLGTEILPVFCLPWGPENHYLEGWIRWGLAQTVNAGVGFNARARFRNPVGSNIVAVVENLILCSTNAAQQQFQLENATGITTDLTTISSSGMFPFDGRFNPSQLAVNSNCVLSIDPSTAAAGLGNTWGQIVLPVGATVQVISDIGQGIPVLPGSALQVRGNATNTNILVTWMWRERFLEADERN